MKKQGVSLIVLIVTIIVIIILATTVILAVSKNNPVDRAREAVFREDVVTFQHELNMVITDEYAEKNGKRYDKITALEYTKEGEKNSVYTYLSSFKKKYENKIAIKEDQIVYVGVDEKERVWLLNSGIYMAKQITVKYTDGYGNEIRKSDKYPMLDVQYKFEAPEIENYMPLNKIEEGIASQDIEITFEYCEICNDLAFIGLDESGNETDVESDIVAYTVAGMGECNNPYVAIPREHNGKSVTQIKANAFAGNSIIKNVTVEGNIEKIGTRAFDSAANLKFATINSKSIDSYVFHNCKALQKVIIGENIAVLPTCCFMYASLNELEIYSENLDIQMLVFRFGSLKKIKVNENNKSYKSVDNVLYSKDGKKLVLYPTAREGEYIIPDEVEEIQKYSFNEVSKLAKLEIPSTVKVVGASAFSDAKGIKELIVNAKKIETNAFMGTGLNYIRIGENVETFIIGQGFRYSTLKTLYLDSDKVNIDGGAFRYCNSFTEVVVNENNQEYKSIDGVLYSKDEKKLILYPTAKEGDYTLSLTVEEIGAHAFFFNTNITNINFNDTMSKWENISKASEWQVQSGIKTITCSDGTITL